MGGFEDFGDAIGDEVELLFNAAHDRIWLPFERRVGEYLGIPNGDTEPDPLHWSASESVLMRLFDGYMEIEDSVNCLRNVAVYMRRFPYARAGVDKAAYLQYHVENYLGEVYILQQRVDAYLTVVSRTYRSDASASKIAQAAKAARSQFRSALGKPLSTRGAHVHRRRYTDSDLEQLGSLRLLAGVSHPMKREYEKAYREVRARKREWISSTNQMVEALLDQAFAVLLPLVFDEARRLRQPGAA